VHCIYDSFFVYLFVQMFYFIWHTHIFLVLEFLALSALVQSAPAVYLFSTKSPRQAFCLSVLFQLPCLFTGTAVLFFTRTVRRLTAYQ